jgi:hypothetical protein
LYIRRTSITSQYKIYQRQAGASIFHRTAQVIAHIDISPQATPVETRRQFPTGYRLTQEAPVPIPQGPTIPPQASTFTAHIAQLDPWESELLVDIQATADPQTILQRLSEGITIVCDGSVNSYEAGSFGWVLSDNEGHRLARCSGPARGYRISSYRAEGYGMLSIFRYICQLYTYTGRTPSTHQLLVACDNKSLVRRVCSLIPREGESQLLLS